jgi:hypothetical protein
MEQHVNRDQLIRAISKLAKVRGVHFAKHTGKGKGSHYVVEYADKWTTIQSDLNPGRSSAASSNLACRCVT